MPWKFTDVSNLCLFLPCHNYLVPGTCGVDLDPSCYEAVLSIWVCMFHLQHIPGSLTKLCISLHPFLHIYQFMTHIMLLQSVTSVRACPWNHRRYRNHRRSWPRIVFKVWRQKVRWFLRFPSGNAQRFDVKNFGFALRLRRPRVFKLDFQSITHGETCAHKNAINIVSLPVWR
jgi:hypothetical protein